jgi:hypothetical protein
LAKPSIPQAVLDEIAANSTARIIVGLDVLWQHEGKIAGSTPTIATQRDHLKNTQKEFVKTPLFIIIF